MKTKHIIISESLRESERFFDRLTSEGAAREDIFTDSGYYKIKGDIDRLKSDGGYSGLVIHDLDRDITFKAEKGVSVEYMDVTPGVPPAKAILSMLIHSDDIRARFNS